MVIPNFERKAALKQELISGIYAELDGTFEIIGPYSTSFLSDYIHPIYSFIRISSPDPARKFTETPGAQLIFGYRRKYGNGDKGGYITKITVTDDFDLTIAGTMITYIELDQHGEPLHVETFTLPPDITKNRISKRSPDKIARIGAVIKDVLKVLKSESIEENNNKSKS